MTPNYNEDDSQLSDFGIQPEEPPAPKIQQAGTIRFVHPKKGLTMSGILAIIRNWEEQPKAYLTTVNPQQHYHNALQGYCISDSALRDCEKQGVEHILIAEKDNGTVYHFHLTDYTERGGSVPERYRQWQADKQTVVKLQNHRHRYLEHREHLYRPEGESTGDFAND